MTIMETNQRIVRCPKHRLDYNSETGRCPSCAFDAVEALRVLAPRPKAKRGDLKFTCPFCGSRTMFEKSCSRFPCRWRIGLRADGSPRPKMNRCRNCGGRTKYATYCTYYPCRQKAGTAAIMMYARRNFGT